MKLTLFSIRVLFCMLLLAAPMIRAQAQAVSPWFRGGKQIWESLLKESAANLGGRASFSMPLSAAATGFSVKTTPHNWLLHRISHSGVFSRMEKEILLNKTSSEKAVLGKLAYFHDRDTRLFNALSTQPEATADEAAFWRHQNLLANTLAELEAYYTSILPEKLASSLFTKEHIKNLLADPIQPPAFVLHKKEIESFAELSNLEEQKAWANYAVQYTYKDLQALLSKDPKSLNGFEFERYYLQKLRLDYFYTLQEVLAKSNHKRNSLIIRRKRTLKTDLPGSDQPMTDAQRLGFLRYHLDKLSVQTIDITQPYNPVFQQYVALKELNQKLAPIYETYAVAEAFGIPYEQTLRLGSLWPDFIVGKVAGEQLRNALGKDLLQQLPPRITALETQMTAMQNQTPTNLDFYVRYYRLEREKALYEVLMIRERLVLGL